MLYEVITRPRWAEGALEHVDEPSADRRDALCALFKQCGGCQLQHLPYAQQLVWKARIVADQLVITSYSIHYTKLYDSSPSGQGCRNPR